MEPCELRARSSSRPSSELTELLDNAPVPIHSVDLSGTILWANRAELALLGYRADEYVGHPIAAFHVDQAALEDIAARVGRGETLHDHPAQLRCKDGSIRYVVISSSLQVSGDQRGSACCFTRDVTTTRRAEDERDRVIADLNRTVRLNDMFAGILGHDLRGPLSTIAMASQLLLSSIHDPRDVRTLQRMLNSAERMQRMIDQLLDFARARADGGIELERRELDVAELARDVVEEIGLAQPGWTVEIDVRGDARGELDANRLSQVFSNLVGNAVQHGDPGAPLRIVIDGRSPAMIRVAIKNRGSIPPEILPVLFAPVRGPQPRATRSHGLGLGLFIVDHIVRAHGGQITADSAGGTTVLRFVVPRRAGDGAEIATFDAGSSAASSDRIPVIAMTEPGSGATSAPPELAKQARRSEERFRMLVESVRDYAIFMLDADGKVATWNTGAQRIKGYTADEIIGQHFSVFYPAHQVEAGKTDHELRIAERDGRFEDEGWRLRKDGTAFWANVVITALRDGHGVLCGFAKITRDLTERRKLEQERLQLAHAQEALRLRDEFLSLASHELKTPLTVLQLQLEALRERADTNDRATLAKLDRSGRAARRLADLIEALLDVSRIATGRFVLQPAPADVGEIVTTAVDRMREVIEAAGCSIHLRIEHVVGMWDRSRIEQVVSNLISNATRYAAGTLIEIAVTEEPGGAAIQVSDHGPGLPDDQLARIFERFERAASMRHYGGLGLGLYVVREITEAHGGAVTASNTAGGGACFTVRLPVATPRADTVV